MSISNGESLSSVRTKLNASLTKTDAMDQGVATTDSPTFAGLTSNGTTLSTGPIYAGAVDTDFSNNGAAGDVGVELGEDGVIQSASSSNPGHIVNRLDSVGHGVQYRYNGTLVGSVRFGTSNVTYNTTSDYRAKTNITNLDRDEAASIIEALRVCEYDWLAGGRGVGVIAHEAQALVPQAVSGEKDAVDKDGTPCLQGVDYGMLVPHLIAAVQQLSSRVSELEAKQADAG